jgi:hypothetical protein
VVVTNRSRFDFSLERIMKMIFFLKNRSLVKSEFRGFLGSEKVPSS